MASNKEVIAKTKGKITRPEVNQILREGVSGKHSGANLKKKEYKENR